MRSWLLCLLAFAAPAATEERLAIPGFDMGEMHFLSLPTGRCTADSEHALSYTVGSVRLACAKAVFLLRSPYSMGEATIFVWDGVHSDQTLAVSGNIVGKDLISLSFAYPSPRLAVRATGYCRLNRASTTQGTPTRVAILDDDFSIDRRLDGVEEVSCTARDIKQGLQLFHFGFKADPARETERRSSRYPGYERRAPPPRGN